MGTMGPTRLAHGPRAGSRAAGWPSLGRPGTLALKKRTGVDPKHNIIYVFIRDL